MPDPTRESTATLDLPDPAPDSVPIRRLYGRTRGHPLTAHRRNLLSDVLPALAVPGEGTLVPAALFPDLASGGEVALELEIGFGKGDHLAFQAARRPKTGFIGAEPYENGVAALLATVEAQGLANVRVHMGNALDVLERLPAASVGRVWLLHPDPWPKNRHAKRRFVNPGPLAMVRRVLRPGGEFRIATDHAGYMRHLLTVMQHQPGFRWTAEGADDWERVPADWPDTRFARKARKLGHEVWRFIYRRLPDEDMDA